MNRATVPILYFTLLLLLTYCLETYLHISYRQKMIVKVGTCMKYSKCVITKIVNFELYLQAIWYKIYIK